MAIDFEIPAEAKAIRNKVRAWVHDECIPAEKRLVNGEDYKTVLGELRQKARSPARRRDSTSPTSSTRATRGFPSTASRSTPGSWSRSCRS